MLERSSIMAHETTHQRTALCRGPLPVGRCFDPSHRANHLRSLQLDPKAKPRDLGEADLQYSDNMLRNLQCQRLQLDEIWCCCYAKNKNVPDEIRAAARCWRYVDVDRDGR